MAVVTSARPRQSALARMNTSLRGYMMRGLLVLVPVGVTAYVLALCYRLTAGRFAPFIARYAVHLPRVAVVFFSVALLFVILYVVGLATALVLGRRMIAFAESILARIPLVKPIYAGAKQFVNVLLLHNNGPTYEAAVLVGFPSPDSKVLAFITGSLTIEGEGEYQKVLVPSAPAPTCGYLQFLPQERIQHTALTVDEAVQSLLSMGIATPEVLPLLAGRISGAIAKPTPVSHYVATPRKTLWNRVVHSLRARLLAGFFALVPIATTAFVIDLLFEHTVGRISPLTDWLVGPMPHTVTILISLGLVVISLYAAGQIATLLIGASLIRFAERFISRIPFVTTLYGATKQIVDRLVREDLPPAFEEAVLVEFPYPGAKSIGFVVGRIQSPAGETLVKVLVPRLPDITIGMLVFCRPYSIYSCGLTVDEAVKMVVSGGIIAPAVMALRPWQSM